MNENLECSFPNARVNEMNTHFNGSCIVRNNNNNRSSNSRSSNSENLSRNISSGHDLPVHRPSEHVDHATKIFLEENKNRIVDNSENKEFTHFSVTVNDQSKVNDHPDDNTEAYLRVICKESNKNNSLFLRKPCERENQIYKNYMDLEKEGKNRSRYFSCLNSSQNRSNENSSLDITLFSNVSNKRENERDTSESVSCNKNIQVYEGIETGGGKPQEHKYEENATFENFLKEFVKMPGDDGEESDIADSDRYMTWSNSTEVCYNALFDTIRRNVEEEKKSQEQEQRKVKVQSAEKTKLHVKNEEPTEQKSVCEKDDKEKEKTLKPIELMDPKLMENTCTDVSKENINITGICVENPRNMRNICNQTEREHGTAEALSDEFKNMLNAHNTEKKETGVGNNELTVSEISSNGVQGFIDNFCSNVDNNVMYNNSSAITNRNSSHTYHMDGKNTQNQNSSNKKRKRKNTSNSIVKKGSVFKHENFSDEHLARGDSSGNTFDMLNRNNPNYFNSYNNNNNNIDTDDNNNNSNNNHKHSNSNRNKNNSSSISSSNSSSSQHEQTDRSNYKHIGHSNVVELCASHDDPIPYQRLDLSKDYGIGMISINNKHDNIRNAMNVYASDAYPDEKLRYQCMSNNNISSNESSPSNNDAIYGFRNSFSYDDINSGGFFNEQKNDDIKGQFMSSCNKMAFSSNMCTSSTSGRHTQQWFDMIYTVCVRLDDLCCNLNANYPHSMQIWENSNGYNVDNLKSLIFNKDTQQTLDNPKNDSSDNNNAKERYVYNTNVNLLSDNMNMAIDKTNEHINGNDISNFSNAFISTNCGLNTGLFDDKRNISQNQIYKYSYMEGIKCFQNKGQTNLFSFANPRNMISDDSKQNSTDKIIDWGNVFNKALMAGQMNNTNCKYVEYINNKKMNINGNNRMDTTPGESLYDHVKNNINTNENRFLFNKNNIPQSNMNKTEMKVEAQSVMPQQIAMPNKVEMKQNEEKNSHLFLKNRSKQMNSGLMYAKGYSSMVNDYTNDSSQSEAMDQQKDMHHVKLPGRTKVRKNTKISNTSKNEEKKKNKKKNLSNKKTKTIKTESEFEYLLDLSDKEGPSSENPDDLKCDVAGVYWDKRSWIASWYDNGKRYYKSFSAKTHGFYKSKFCAIKVRLSKVKGQTIFGKNNLSKKNSTGENSSTENMSAENSAINIQSNTDHLLQQQQQQQQQQRSVNMPNDVNRLIKRDTSNGENLEIKNEMNITNDIDTMGCGIRNNIDCIHFKTESNTKSDVDDKVEHIGVMENKNNFNKFRNTGNISFTV